MPRGLDFTAALRARPLVFDGAMGTQIYERGVLYTQNFDQLCVTRPELVAQVHASYVAASADVLQTNTFGANRYRLAVHNLEGQIEAINRAGVRIAREAAGDSAYVAGSIGPSGRILKSMRGTEQADLIGAFRDQCSVLLEAGVDALILETFRQPEELRLAIEGARLALEAATQERRAPIIASVSFDPFGVMADGTGPADMARRIESWGAHMIGVNCADGPAGVFETATAMLGTSLPVIAQPNAGLPRRVEGRFAYMATPEYFLVYARRMLKAGVRAVGGCCGTTPDHVRQMAAAARMLAAGMESAGNENVSVIGAHEVGATLRDQNTSSQVIGIDPLPLAERGALGAKAATKFVVSVEVNPPPGTSLASALDASRMLQAGGVDFINVADGPRATARMGNFVLCHRIQEELGMPSLMHVTTRDRNVLGLVAHLLGCHELGVRNLVVITGDPPKMGDFPDATPVYDLDSIGLLRLVANMNRGVDPGGKALGGATRFVMATGAEPAAQDYERELERLRRKRQAGADLVMTQPVYDPEILERFLRDVEPLGIPVWVGLLPLASYRNAEFLHNEVPGMSVPTDIRERMRKAGTGEPARREGVAIAREMLERVRHRVAGAYIMPPLGRYELALRVIDGIV